MKMENTINLLKTGAAAVLGGAAYWLGGLDKLLLTLGAVMVLDYITGLLCAWHTKSLSSAIGFRGIVKKVMLLTVVALAFLVEELTGGILALREITIMFFVVNEGLSILENAAGTGLPLPDRLRQVLRQLGSKEE